MNTQTVGGLAEQQARAFLEKQGLIWRCSNFRCQRGEIDLIMRDQKMLVFIEVRFRSNRHGEGIETISRNKQLRIISAAWSFLIAHRLIDKIDCRFDVIGISYGEYNWIQNAFEVEY